MSMKSEPTVWELFDLTGKVALISGGSGWLGGAMSRALAEAGAQVIIGSSRGRDMAQEAADALPSSQGQHHLGVQLDHMNEPELNKGFEEALRLSGGVDILINNGMEWIQKDWQKITGEEFTRQQQNSTGYFLLARHVRNHAVECNKPASVINLGSMYGQVASYPEDYVGMPILSPAAYHALKGGIIQLTRHLAAYWAKDDVRVNTLSPGPFPKTPTSEWERIQSKRVPMGRIGRPYELKGTLILLASDAGSFITGENITVDGGWCAW